ncbi:MAG: GNAT family N-acetyltransferase [Planctomycetota bacterium]|nr:GNAT family N-acetyltransferase [Planctomycetota bacterium]
MSTSRMRMRLDLTHQAVDSTPSMRPPCPDDVESLAELMLAAYAGGSDVDGDETIEDARGEIQKTFDGRYGAFMPELSSLVMDERRIVAATLITFFDEHPLVSFTMTHPDWKRRGLGRATICRSINLLLESNWQTLDLVVTRENDPAVNLYKKMGFCEIENDQPNG